MLEQTNYKDITFTYTNGIIFITMKHKIRFGTGWTGNDAKILGVEYPYGGLKGIVIFITVTGDPSAICNCCLESPNDKIYIGLESTGDAFNWSDPITHVERLELDREIGEIADEILNWDEETLEKMRTEYEAEEALQGQID